ncbi:DoxX family protein [Mucilaginibacter gossypii]|uniref:DoxX family protein n=1 Tax=Mucilaginibacter gossypii TaxID=551996 RepID=UPI000DCEE034|nr:MULTISPECIES: DoxX family protein [Mucilaginibacter]QTE34825.1 DoxX family protein [Mucilaginibacter gossypii]RAV59659.1 DoxX family protein [Mucilaginibacter rubeus]
MTYTQFNILVWALRLVAAIIMLQTLFFKFTAAPESVYIFTKLGMEPWGRIGIGSMELIAAILIIIPRTTGIGALIAVGLMAGAIFFHLTKLGIVVQGDGGQLFILATIVFATSAILLYIFRKEVLNLIPLLH